MTTIPTALRLVRALCPVCASDALLVRQGSRIFGLHVLRDEPENEHAAAWVQVCGLRPGERIEVRGRPSKRRRRAARAASEEPAPETLRGPGA
jgi:hypothetical protein